MITRNVDGGARGNPGPAGYGAVITDEHGQVLAELYDGIGISTNNVAEYRGLLAALEWALEHGHTRLHVKSDSLLIVQQMLGNYRVKHEGLIPLYRQARHLVAQDRQRHLRARPARAEQGSRPAVEPRNGSERVGRRRCSSHVAAGSSRSPVTVTDHYCAAMFGRFLRSTYF